LQQRELLFIFLKGLRIKKLIVGKKKKCLTLPLRVLMITRY